jgi:hypothetical protein
VAAVVGLSGWLLSGFGAARQRQDLAGRLAAAEGRVAALAAEKERLAAGGLGDRQRLAALEAEVERQLTLAAQLQERLAEQETRLAEAAAPRPLLGLPIVDLEPEQVYRGEEPPQPAGGRRGETALLMLRLPRPVGAPRIQLEVLDDAGRPLHRLTAAAPQGEYVPLALPTAGLPRGVLTLRLSALGEGEPSEVARYRLRLE